MLLYQQELKHAMCDSSKLRLGKTALSGMWGCMQLPCHHRHVMWLPTCGTCILVDASMNILQERCHRVYIMPGDRALIAYKT